MNILLISQCDKRALAETRRILDQFAERRGQRTWQTPITLEGLNTLRRLLRRTARRNTAVACHWIRGIDRSELLWIVGDASRFNLQGAVPTNTTTRDILRKADENDWHTGEDIRLLAALAALFHDLGKACKAFQRRLRSKSRPERNIYRHEWISLRLLQAFVGEDNDERWLSRLTNPSTDDDERWLTNLVRDGLDDEAAPPFSGFSESQPVAQALAWLILSHHRIPKMPNIDDFRSSRLKYLLEEIDARWNENNPETNPQAIRPYWKFEHGLPTQTSRWRRRVRQLAETAQARHGFLETDWLANPYALHLARLCLMLGDHHYSHLHEPSRRTRGEPDYPLYANTNPNEPRRPLSQRLDEHLLGVEAHTSTIARALPSLFDALPRISRHKGFRRRSTDKRFRWQDKAFDTAEALRDQSAEHGFFGINMASTGCGKTLANGRILYALAHPVKGVRFTIALGLRTLTLQTGREYRRILELGADDLAIRVGGASSRSLFEHFQATNDSGSESAEDILADNSYVHFDGNFDHHPVLKRIAHNPHAKSLIDAPILVCTVDHLVPATESLRGGHQIAPMLRLLSGDLVLDEPDDFDIDDLPALARLVHWAGLLGSRVLVSSATLPPALLQALFDAYRSGRREYQRNRGVAGRRLEICCAWFDENGAQARASQDVEDFLANHREFVDRRIGKLEKVPPRRLPVLKPLDITARRPEDIRREFAETIRPLINELHATHHGQDESTGKRVSFGLVRMANIDPMIDVARTLYSRGAPEGCRIHLCVYHANHPLVIRSRMEHQLDQALDRRDPDAVFALPDIRTRLTNHQEMDQIFVVLASPVAEVGRDHDYDWAIVEPSSMRSIIQLAGRVRRHRTEPCEAPNIHLLNCNIKHFEHLGKPAYCRPGFESHGPLMLHSHKLHDLLNEAEQHRIDAAPRIRERQRLRHKQSLVDLEHARLHMRLTGESRLPDLAAYHWWHSPAPLTGVMQQKQRFRKPSGEEDELRLMPDDAGEDFYLERIEIDGRISPVDKQQHHRIELSTGPRIQPWADDDYLVALGEIADAFDLPLQIAAERFGTVTLRRNEQGWNYHPALGFSYK